MLGEGENCSVNYTAGQTLHCGATLRIPFTFSVGNLFHPVEGACLDVLLGEMGLMKTEVACVVGTVLINAFFPFIFAVLGTKFKAS